MKSNVELRFERILNNYGRGPKKISIEGRENQEEFSCLVNQIQKYGFQFEPEHYVGPLVDRLENLVNSN